MSESSKASFSKGIKEELIKEMPAGRHCQIAEIAAITAFSGIEKVSSEDSCDEYRLSCESPELAKKYFTLLNKTIKISECANTIRGIELARLRELVKARGEGETGFAPVNDILLQQECCRKAFLRGAFLAAGSVSDPNKSYHLDITGDDVLSKQVYDVFGTLGVKAKISKRKAHQVVYIKEGTLLVEVLGLMGAPLGLMEFENVRILKDIRNDLNRKVNCEAANIKKTISAAMSQLDDIAYIDDKIGIEELPASLREVAALRRQYPDASLTELGEMMDPPVGKSGINHRLRRISGIADNMRKEGEHNEKGSSS